MTFLLIWRNLPGKANIRFEINLKSFTMFKASFQYKCNQNLFTFLWYWSCNFYPFNSLIQAKRFSREGRSRGWKNLLGLWTDWTFNFYIEKLLAKLVSLLYCQAPVQIQIKSRSIPCPFKLNSKSFQSIPFQNQRIWIRNWYSFYFAKHYHPPRKLFKTQWCPKLIQIDF